MPKFLVTYGATIEVTAEDASAAGDLAWDLRHEVALGLEVEFVEAI